MKPLKIAVLSFSDFRGYPPLVRLSEAAARLDFEVTFLHWRSPKLDRFQSETGSMKVVHGVTRFHNRWIRTFQSLVYVAKAFHLVWLLKVDVVWVVDPHSRFLAVLMALVRRQKCIYIEYDEPALPTTMRSNLREMVGWVAFRVCDGVFIPNESRRRRFMERNSPLCPIVVLPNHPLRSEFVELNQINDFSGSGELRLYYHGSFVEERMPLTLLEALREVEGVRLVVRPVSPDVHQVKSWLSVFASTATEYGISHRVDFVNSVNFGDIWRDASTCHVGVAFFSSQPGADINLQSMWGASNKFAQYAAFGLTILCSTCEAEVLENLSDCAFFCDMADSSSIAKSLRYALANPAEVNLMRRRIYKKALANWTLESSLASEEVRSLLGARRSL